MTVKALKKQLMAAIAMVVVSAIALSSSTYAWFAANTQVEVTGMKVQAKVTGSLYIYDTETNTKPASAAITANRMDFAMATGTALKPTSTQTLANNSWYSAAAAVPSAYDKTGNYAPIAAEDLDEYRLLKTVYVRGESDFTNLQVTGITINGGNDDIIDDAVTIALKCTDEGGQSVWYCNEATTNRHGAVTGVSTTGDLTFAQVSGTGLSGVLLPSGTKDTVYTIEIYIYYDGESSTCYTNAANGVNVDGLSASITLGATFAP